jgi:hypothetical protein
MEQKNNSGSLFSQKKEKDSQPDYSGTATVNGQQYRISGWINKSKAGMSYLRILFSEQQQQDLNAQAAQGSMKLTPGASQGPDLTDDLPF